MHRMSVRCIKVKVSFTRQHADTCIITQGIILIQWDFFSSDDVSMHSAPIPVDVGFFVVCFLNRIFTQS